MGAGGAAAGDLADHGQGRHPDWREEPGQGLQEERRWSSSQNPLIFCTFKKTVRLPSGAPGWGLPIRTRWGPDQRDKPEIFEGWEGGGRRIC